MISAQPINPRISHINEENVMLTWDTPRNASSTKRYIVQGLSTNKPEWKTLTTVEGTSTDAKINNFSPTDYRALRIFAEYDSGVLSKPTEVANLTKYSKTSGNKKMCTNINVYIFQNIYFSYLFLFTAKPLAPGDLTIKHVDDESLTLSWGAPPSDGSNDASDYLIEIKLEGEDTYKPFARVDGSAHSYTCEKLPSDQKCQFRVYAVNDVGKSPNSTELRDYVSIKGLSQLPEFKG